MSNRCIFLTPEERYDIFVVKAAERPHYLLQHEQNDNEEKLEEDCTALIDGCDIPSWRQEALAVRDHFCFRSQTIFNVGFGCSLLRRERQFPIPTILKYPCRNSTSKTISTQNHDTTNKNANTNDVIPSTTYSSWEKLRDRLLYEATSTNVPVVQYDEMCDFVADDSDDNDSSKKKERKFAYYEKSNIPVIIKGCTRNWKAAGARPDDHDTTTTITSNISSRTSNTNNSSNNDDGEKNINNDILCHRWTIESMVRRFGNLRWRFSDTHGEMMTLQTYWKYISTLDGGLLDDSPLGIYDSQFGDDDDEYKNDDDTNQNTCDSTTMNALLQEYSVPECFSYDIFAIVDENDDDHENDNNHADNDDIDDDNNDINDGDYDSDDNDDDDTTSHNSRPPWRWILMGPERSGTGLHIDPLYTNAWVTVLQGTKRWILFPPWSIHLPDADDYNADDYNSTNTTTSDTNRNTCDTNSGDSNSIHSSNRNTKNMLLPWEAVACLYNDHDPQIPSSIWFAKYYGILKQQQQQEEEQGKQQEGNRNTQNQFIEVLQHAGETVFVPNGWPHIVLNLETTVAVTHNYASEYSPNVLKMWNQMCKEEPKFAQDWYSKLVTLSQQEKEQQQHQQQKQKQKDNKDDDHHLFEYRKIIKQINK